MGTHNHAVTQDVQDQADFVQEDEAEPPDPAVDPSAHWQHHPVQRQAPSLASHKAQPVNEQLWNSVDLNFRLSLKLLYDSISSDDDISDSRYHIEKGWIKRGCAVKK